MSLKKQVDVLIIGAGPSGSVAAGILHKAGVNVQIVEKMRFPRFVIGESLLPRCMEALEEAGLLEAVATAGFQQKTGAKFIWGGNLFVTKSEKSVRALAGYLDMMQDEDQMNVVNESR